MHVLITGGAGFIGSHVAERLIAQGHQVQVLDNLSTGKIENLPTSELLRFQEGDIRDQGLVAKCCEQADAVIHLAAVASVQASVDDPAGTHQSNFDGTLNLLEACRNSSVKRFLYACSAAIYGDTEVLPVTEETALNPLTPYAVDKLSGEYYLGYYSRQYGLNTSSFRFFNIYGPRQDPSSPYSGVISIMADRLLSEREMTIFGDGEQTRDFVYVGDLADLLIESLARTDMSGSVMNVGTGKQTSLLDLKSALESVSGKKLEVSFDKPRAGDIKFSCAAVTRLEACFGKAPTTTIEDGLKKLLE